MKKITSLLACLLMIGACTEVAVISGATYGILSQEEDINFTEQSYAVADYLIQPAQSYIKRYDLIAAEPLKDSEHPTMSSTLSKMIPERIGTRFSQLGYRVDLSQVSTGGDGHRLSPAAKGEKAKFVLAGSYLRRRNEMDVNMRIIDVRAGRIISSFDYTVELSRDLKDLSEPKPQIIRVTN